MADELWKTFCDAFCDTKVGELRPWGGDSGLGAAPISGPWQGLQALAN